MTRHEISLRWLTFPTVVLFCKHSGSQKWWYHKDNVFHYLIFIILWADRLNLSLLRTIMWSGINARLIPWSCQNDFGTTINRDHYSIGTTALGPWVSFSHQSCNHWTTLATKVLILLILSWNFVSLSNNLVSWVSTKNNWYDNTKCGFYSRCPYTETNLGI